MQSLHVYDYFCYWEWNVEGNIARNPVLDSKDIKAALGSIVAQMMDAYSYII